MVGALADWFAVTALFRHPLGIPIPHTAIIPKRKDQIGRSLGEFVEGNFLTHEVLSERLAHAGVGRRLGQWLSQPHNAARASEGLGDALKGTLEVLDDKEVQDGLERIVRTRIDAQPAAPLVGKAIDLSVEGGHHQRLLDAVLIGLRGFLDDNRHTFRKRLDHESPWWVPEPIDDRIFEKIYSAVGALPHRGRRRPRPRGPPLDRHARAGVRRAAEGRPRAPREGRGAQARAARAPGGAALARVALARHEAGHHRRRDRRDLRAPHPHDHQPATHRPAPRRRAGAATQGRHAGSNDRSATWSSTTAARSAT